MVRREWRERGWRSSPGCSCLRRRCFSRRSARSKRRRPPRQAMRRPPRRRPPSRRRRPRQPPPDALAEPDAGPRGDARPGPFAVGEPDAGVQRIARQPRGRERLDGRDARTRPPVRPPIIEGKANRDEVYRRHHRLDRADPRGNRQGRAQARRSPDRDFPRSGRRRLQVSAPPFRSNRSPTARPRFPTR